MLHTIYYEINKKKPKITCFAIFNPLMACKGNDSSSPNLTLINFL